MTKLEQLKQSGEAPSFLGEEGYITLSNGYLKDGETPKQMYLRVSNASANRLNRQDLASKFFDIMWAGHLSLASPVASNMGTDNLPISCYAGSVPDSTLDIHKHYTEIAMLSKYGGGTGSYWGNVRGRGAPISKGGTSNGIVPWLKTLESVVRAVSQGSTRRGAVAAYLDVEHPDIEEFIDVRKNSGDISMKCLSSNFHHAICISDEFMQNMKDGNQKNRSLWAHIMKQRAETGEPYLMWKDTANKASPQMYKDLGLKVETSNLCITGDQRVVSNFGYLTAKELYDKGENLILFNGHRPVESSPMKLRENKAKVYKITLENGMTHKVTEYHGLPVLTDRDTVTRIEAKNINIGDKIMIQTNEGIFGSKHMADEAFLLGMYQGDGTQSANGIHLDLWENDFDLIPAIEETFTRIHAKYASSHYEIKNSKTGISSMHPHRVSRFTDCTVRQSTVKKKRLTSNVLNKIEGFKKGKVPNWIWESDSHTHWQYIKGLLYTDGTVYVNQNSFGNPIQLSLASINYAFLEEVQLIFNNLGLQSSIKLLRPAGESLLPDGKGGHRLYHAQEAYRLIVGNKNACIKIDEKIGFLSRKKIDIEKRQYRDNTKKAYKVKSVEFAGEEAVYCPTIFNDEHLFVVNGLLTFNCNEIYLHTDRDHTFVCCLSSMNLAKYDEWKDTDAVYLATWFLDGVMEEFISKASKIEGFEKSLNFATKSRALGLGVLGWHTLLQSKMIPFDSFEAMQKNAEVFRFIDKETRRASQDMAKELGEPEWCKGYGVRNTHLTAIAPTTTNSILAGGVSQGIEPISANLYNQKTSKGVFIRKNPILEELLAKKEKNTVEVWNQINEDKGSVKNLSFLSKEEKLVFLTAREINQFSVVRQAGQRQKWISQGQSVNLFFAMPSDINSDEEKSKLARYIHDVHMEAWELGLKGLYYLKTESVLKGDPIFKDSSDCAACES